MRRALPRPGRLSRRSQLIHPTPLVGPALVIQVAHVRNRGMVLLRFASQYSTLLLVLRLTMRFKNCGFVVKLRPSVRQ